MDWGLIDRLSSQLREDIVAMIRSGIRASDVADEFGMTERCVYSIARRAGQPMMYRAMRRAILLGALRRGQSIEYAASALGIKPESAYRMELRHRKRQGAFKPRSTRLRT